MRKRKQQRHIDLEPHEWRVITDKPAREPFFGPSWRVLPYTLIMITLSVWIDVNLGPWIMISLRSVL
jgi:hypothetical protein